MTDKKTSSTETTTRQRRRKVRMEDHAFVQEWCANFVAKTEGDLGMTPTKDQAVQAFLAEAGRKMTPDGRGA